MDNLQKPKFCHHEKYINGLKNLFQLFQSGPELQTAIASSILVKNGIILLNGTYGTGKTQLVNLIKRQFFVSRNGEYDYDYETCHQDLTVIDVLYHLDLAELQQGREIVHPKKIVNARLKFLNEIQRANPTLYNALLPLLSERSITYRDMVFHSPDFLLLMDQNPQDAASSEIPKAFFDRIDIMINLSNLNIHNSVNLFKKRNLPNGIVWDGLEKLADSNSLYSDEIDDIWNDVLKVRINDNELYFANFLINSFSECIKADRSLTTRSFNLDCNSCKYKAEVCSHLLEVPGYRALTSTFKLSQARAWLAKREVISTDDLIFCLPYALSHRLSVKREELVTYENAFIWLKNRAINEILRNKFESWNVATEKYFENDYDKIREIAKENLVVDNLLNLKA